MLPGQSVETAATAAASPVAATTPEASAGASPPLRLEQVSKRWRKAPGSVLDQVDLTLPAGSLTWVGGRNGAGKTTLLRIAAGVIMPDAGRVTSCGIDPERHRRAFQGRVGFLSTGTSGLYARLTVREHLEYQSKLDLLRPAEARDVIEREFTRFNLEEIDGRRVDRLSMGQRQRLRLAMVMLRAPRLLLLDEPSNSLDAEGVAILHAAVADVTRGGGAVLWCSPTGERHTLPFDRRLHLADGRLEER
jgi:ABC-2 type transport system ATP-binding protein